MVSKGDTRSLDYRSHSVKNCSFHWDLSGEGFITAELCTRLSINQATSSVGVFGWQASRDIAIGHLRASFLVVVRLRKW